MSTPPSTPPDEPGNDVPDELVLPNCSVLDDEMVDQLAENWRLPAYWLVHVDGELARGPDGALRVPFSPEPEHLAAVLPKDGKSHHVKLELRATHIETGRPGLKAYYHDMGMISLPAPGLPVMGPAPSVEPRDPPLGAGPATHYWQAHTVPPPDAFMALVRLAGESQAASMTAMEGQRKAFAKLAKAERRHNREMFLSMVSAWNTQAKAQLASVDQLAERLTEALAGVGPGEPVREAPAPATPEDPLVALARHAPALLKTFSEWVPEEARAELVTGLMQKFTGGNQVQGLFGELLKEGALGLLHKFTGYHPSQVPGAEAAE